MADDPPLSQRGEHPFLRQLVNRLRAREAMGPRRSGAQLLLGAGDDAAVFQPGTRPLAVTTDALIEGVHFRTEWLDPEELGRRSIEVNLSDLAAMAAQPRFLLAAVAAPACTSTAWLDSLLDGCAEASSAGGAMLIGGNLARADVISVTVTAIGEIPGRRLDRSGARPGDELVVTGTLGDAAAAIRAWLDGEEPGPEQRDRWARPQARVHAGLALAEAGARAAIDLSDGLLADLGHLCEASGVGAEIERERIPRTRDVARLDARGADFAAGGGEDYELLAACPPEMTSGLTSLAKRANVPLTVIGKCTDRSGEVSLLDAQRQPVPLAVGFDHFARAARQG